MSARDAVTDALRADLRALGASTDEAGHLLDELQGLRDLAERPEPSAELAALLEGRSASSRSGHAAVATRSGSLGAALVLVVAGVGATGLSAAANTLPTPVQERVSRFSHQHLPFQFPAPPSRADRAPVDPVPDWLGAPAPVVEPGTRLHEPAADEPLAAPRAETAGVPWTVTWSTRPGSGPRPATTSGPSSSSAPAPSAPSSPSASSRPSGPASPAASARPSSGSSGTASPSAPASGSASARPSASPTRAPTAVPRPRPTFSAAPRPTLPSLPLPSVVPWPSGPPSASEVPTPSSPPAGTPSSDAPGPPAASTPSGDRTTPSTDQPQADVLADVPADVPADPPAGTVSP